MGEITQSLRSQQASDAGGHQTGRQPGHSARLQSLCAPARQVPEMAQISQL